VVGRNYNGVPDNPCRVKRIPSPIPAKQWYLRPPVIALTGGLLPFGSIFIEMYFIFTSFWNYKARPRPLPSLPPSGSKFIDVRASGASVATGRPSKAPVGRRGRPSRNAWQGRKHCTTAFWKQLFAPTPFSRPNCARRRHMARAGAIYCIRLPGARGGGAPQGMASAGPHCMAPSGGLGLLPRVGASNCYQNAVMCRACGTGTRSRRACRTCRPGDLEGHQAVLLMPLFTRSWSCWARARLQT